jgi:hypothetical protein
VHPLALIPFSPQVALFHYHSRVDLHRPHLARSFSFPSTCALPSPNPLSSQVPSVPPEDAANRTRRGTRAHLWHDRAPHVQALLARRRRKRSLEGVLGSDPKSDFQRSRKMTFSHQCQKPCLPVRNTGFYQSLWQTRQSKAVQVRPDQAKNIKETALSRHLHFADEHERTPQTERSAAEALGRTNQLPQRFSRPMRGRALNHQTVPPRLPHMTNESSAS